MCRPRVKECARRKYIYTNDPGDCWSTWRHRSATAPESLGKAAKVQRQAFGQFNKTTIQTLHFRRPRVRVPQQSKPQTIEAISRLRYRDLSPLQQYT